MPRSAPRPCGHPGCGVLVSDGTGRCPAHKTAMRREADQRRGSAHARGYTGKWAVAAKMFLARHPLCMCPECGAGSLRVTQATVVDHVVPHRGDMRLFWDTKNWQAMAKSCHDRKTARHDGGFGRARTTKQQEIV